MTFLPHLTSLIRASGDNARNAVKTEKTSRAAAHVMLKSSAASTTSNSRERDLVWNYLSSLNL